VAAATGEAIVGELTGTRLTFLPAQIVSLVDFAAAHPEGDVLSRETGFDRDYGRNPYVGYDAVDENPFLFDGVLDGRLPPKERVVTVGERDNAVAFPYSELRKVGVASATVDGRRLTFVREGGVAAPIRDRETGSTWSVTSIATDGELAGTRLEPVIHGDHFWFAWAAFSPKTTIRTAG